MGGNKMEAALKRGPAEGVSVAIWRLAGVSVKTGRSPQRRQKEQRHRGRFPAGGAAAPPAGRPAAALFDSNPHFRRPRASFPFNHTSTCTKIPLRHTRAEGAELLTCSCR